MKIISLGIICLFITVGLTTNVVSASEDSYPDLVPDLEYIKDDFREGYYHIFIIVKNDGDTDALFPEGTVIAKLKTEFKLPSKTVQTKHKASEDRIIQPGDILDADPDDEFYGIYAGTVHYIFLIGAKQILTLDPDNVVDEGPNGEENNVLEEISFRLSRQRTFSLLMMFQKFFSFLQNFKLN